MRCPVCGTELESKEIFCPKCGQPISQSDKNTELFNDYWEENNAASQEFNAEQDQKIRKSIKKTQKKRIKSIIGVMVFGIVCCVALLFALDRNKKNEQLLINVQKNMIGHTYENMDKSALVVGDSSDRMIIKVVDENTIEYTEGNYQSYMTESKSLKWRENEIYEKGTCDYKLSISLLGEVKIYMLGSVHKVIMDEDGSVRTIRYYND